MAAGRTGTGAALCGLLAAALLTAGCGTARGGGGGAERTAPADTRPRMERVAAAWTGSAALRQWREGFHPLGEQDWAPPGGFRSGEDKAAAVNGAFVLGTGLPAGPPPATPVRWDSGGAELTLPLLSAQEAYGQLVRADGAAVQPGHALTVTAAAFGETTVRTSRGPARVPAWLFTVGGYDTPLARIAIRPQELPEPPIEPLPTFDGGTAPLFGHSAASPDVTSFEVTAGHGGCDGGVAVDVLEGADTVVLAGRILPGKDLGPGEGCNAAMYEQSVPVTLTRPLGERLVVDSASGAPLERGTRRR
ncbi:hypothetical protein ACIGFK_13555 [Streptomyces sp. NPDC085524]|uniref:hypothetical protein n=1 Tax=Streptomyces sp. NPDC085524 TaxID=3365728 RepID=UPI0037D3010F